MSEVVVFRSEIRVHLVPPELNVSASAGENGEGKKKPGQDRGENRWWNSVRNEGEKQETPARETQPGPTITFQQSSANCSRGVGGGRESTSDKMAPPELAEWGARTTFRWSPQPRCLAPPTYRYAQELLRGRGTTRTLDGGEGRLEEAGVTFPKIRRASSELPGST